APSCAAAAGPGSRHRTRRCARTASPGPPPETAGSPYPLFLHRDKPRTKAFHIPGFLSRRDGILSGVREGRRLRALMPVLLALPAPVRPQSGRPRPAERSSVVLDGRELGVLVTIPPGGPLFNLKPLVDSLGGQLGGDESGESVSLKIEGTEVVIGSGSAVI